MKPAFWSAWALAIAALCYAILMGGCTSWRAAAHTSLATSHEALKGASQVAETHFERRAIAAATACKKAAGTAASQPIACPPAAAALADLRAFNRVIIGARAAIQIGIVAAMLGDEKQVKAIMAKLAGLAAQVQSLLAKGGVLAW